MQVRFMMLFAVFAAAAASHCHAACSRVSHVAIFRYATPDAMTALLLLLLIVTLMFSADTTLPVCFFRASRRR